MREESHLDDMRSAIRGDFERLAERRGGQELMRTPDEEPEPAPPPEDEPESFQEPPQPEHATESFQEPPPEPKQAPTEELVPQPELEDVPEPAREAEAEAPPHRSWLDRLLGR